MARILLIDDDPNLREVLSFTLSDQGHEVETAASGEAGLEAAAAFHPEVLLTDLRMPGGMDGLQVLKGSMAEDPARPVILLTAFGTVEDAVEAMKQGAFDYLTKPCNREELRLRIEAALERRRLLRENRTLRHRLREASRKVEIVHASPAMASVLEMVRRVAPSEATVLVTGESGTGKDLIARALHAGSDRWEGPFVAVSCAAIPRELLESELFGHSRGAFTGASRERAGKFRQADGGTLFLDEIAEMAPDLQAKLLRVLETREVDVVGGARPVPVDVRIVAATNADLGARVADGAFRSDLYFRLNVIPIHLPPLRERPEDVPALWEHFVRRYAGAHTDGGAKVRTSPGLMRALAVRRWAGNVRELANLCQRMVLLRREDTLTEEDLAEATRDTAVPAGTGSAGVSGEAGARGEPGGSGSFLGELPPDTLPLFEVEREIIERALARFEGNKTRAATYLGIPRHVLLYRLEKFGIR